MKEIIAPNNSIFLRKDSVPVISFSAPPLNFHLWHSVCLLPFIELNFFQSCGDLNEIGRNQGQPEEVKEVVTCVPRALENETMEAGVKKGPDLHKDDLAQRRIQRRLTLHREAPSFVTLSNITEADLETWERLKLSGKTRCVMVFPSSGVI